MGNRCEVARSMLLAALSAQQIVRGPFPSPQCCPNVLNGGNGSCLHAIAQFCHSSQKKEEIYFLVLIFTFRSVCIEPVCTLFSKGPICLPRGDHQELVSRIFPRLQDTLLFGAGGVTVPMLLHHPDPGPLKQTPGAETGTGPLSGVKTLGQSIHLVLPCTLSQNTLPGLRYYKTELKV